MISIRDIIHRYAATLGKQWSHDRSATVGASEIGQCARKTWFVKHDAPRDPDYVETWGARFRGDLIENHFWLPALRSRLPGGVRLLYAGEEQETLIDGYLSATTDGLLVWPDEYCINLDCKSIDPRIDLQKEKTEHSFQVQVQMGLIRHCTPHQPDQSILSYINASFFDDVREYVIRWNPRIYRAAQARARDIMTARDPLDLPPEGKMAGGGECHYCAWASHCAAVTVAGIPTSDSTLDDDAANELKAMRNIERELAAAKETAAEEHARAQEDIKRFLRQANVRRHKGDGWSVSYSPTSGKTTLDIAAIDAAGIDLSPFYKPGKSGERLTVR